jgi:hypothetical protein
MGRRPIVLFWGAVAAAVFFLGSAWAAAGRLGSGPHALADGVVMGISLAGFVATAFVAGRIAFVIGRAQRPRQPPDDERAIAARCFLDRP